LGEEKHANMAEDVDVEFEAVDFKTVIEAYKDLKNVSY